MFRRNTAARFIAEHALESKPQGGYREPRHVEHGAKGWPALGQGGCRRERGAPVDVQVMPDGALLVSDDTAGAVYRSPTERPGEYESINPATENPRSYPELAGSAPRRRSRWPRASFRPGAVDVRGALRAFGGRRSWTAKSADSGSS
jgi:hypothetical protein